MDRQQKINKLKAIMEGKVQPLQDQNLFWQQLDNGLYQCETHGFTHLILTKENMNKFQQRFGGYHIVFESYTDDRDEPIEDGSDNVIRWKESRSYDDEPTQPTRSEIKPIEPIREPEPDTKPLKKERKKKARKRPTKINPRAKEKEAYQRMLQEQEADQENWDRLRQLSQANQQLNNEISGLL